MARWGAVGGPCSPTRGSQTEEIKLRNVLAVAAMTGVVLTLSSAADARGGDGGGNFNTPGQMFRQHGAYKDSSGRVYPGASGYAPGRRMRMNGGPGYTDLNSGRFYPGATYWTPRNNLGYPTAK